MSGSQENYFEVFKRFVAWLSDIKIISKIITNTEGKIHLHTKIKGASFLLNIKKFKQNLKINKFPIRNSQPISHIST